MVKTWKYFAQSMQNNQKHAHIHHYHTHKHTNYIHFLAGMLHASSMGRYLDHD